MIIADSPAVVGPSGNYDDRGADPTFFESTGACVVPRLLLWCSNCVALNPHTVVQEESIGSARDHDDKGSEVAHHLSLDDGEVPASSGPDDHPEILSVFCRPREYPRRTARPGVPLSGVRKFLPHGIVGSACIVAPIRRLRLRARPILHRPHDGQARRSRHSWQKTPAAAVLRACETIEGASGAA